MQPHDVWHNLGFYEVTRHVNQILVSFCLNNIIKGGKRDAWSIWCMLQVFNWVSTLNCSIYRKGEQGWHRCSRCLLPLVALYLTSRGRHAPVNCDTETTGQLAEQKCRKRVTEHIQGVKSYCDCEQDQHFFFLLPSSVPAKHTMQGSRAPKTSPMRWSVSFDSTLSCIALSTLWPADPCSHVSEWTTRWLRLWWTEFWQRMDNMRSCSWEQVRLTPLLPVVSWNSISDQQRALDHYELWSCRWKNEYM